MTSGVFDGIWSHGQKLFAYDEGVTSGRSFLGFIEPSNLVADVVEARTRVGFVPNEEHRLIATPSETFPYGTETMIVCGTAKFEVLSVKEIYSGEKVSHRECMLLKAGEVESDA
ncbi:MAG: hypothetical protein CVU91_08825 [Firmicutes bacterium HGW-Firmicutes-16]|nr:MAG: hypothetical protein CVU91_08825 [Firmicutes bacterium HGW-Firmicutes-16]